MGAALSPPSPEDTPIFVSVSGGKDSTATALWLKEQGHPFTAVFANTQWEHEATIRYVRETLPEHIGPIHEVRAQLGMAGLARKKGIFPSRLVRYCTWELKVKPILAFLNERDPERRAINAVGIRAGESKARSRLLRWEHDGNGIERWVWRPIIDWTVSDVVAIHRRHGLPLNPLYGKGANRVGCWPCIYARKAEIRLIAHESPERIDEIRALEGELRSQRIEKQGDCPDHQTPSFFGYKGANDRGRALPVLIDEAVEWSRTSRGGRQYELFYEPARESCMRWGMCESGEDDPEAGPA